MWWLPVLRRAALQEQSTTPEVARKSNLVFVWFECIDGWEYNVCLARKSVSYSAQFGHTAACEHKSNTQGVAPFGFRQCLGRQSKSSSSTSAA